MKIFKLLNPLLLFLFFAVISSGCSFRAKQATESQPSSESYPTETTQEETMKKDESMHSDDYWNVNYDGIKTSKINVGVSVHDPSIYYENDTFYIFGTHMASAKSSDGKHFSYLGNGYSKTNAVYSDLWAEDSHVFDYAGDKDSIIPTDDGNCHVWAPDVIYNKAMGCYCLYYCTSSTWNASNLCYATADNIEGPYTWQGALIYSGFTSKSIDATNVTDYVEKEEALNRYTLGGGSYKYNNYPNAIDPHVFYDEDDRLWMVYGSWSGGIFLLELNEKTGEVIHPEDDKDNEIDAYFGKRLMGGKHKSIEDPYILYDKTSGYYYLFVSYGSLTRTGGYQIRVFRSDKVDGEYIDMNGKRPLESDLSHAISGLKLSGNYMLPSLSVAYMATGHNSTLVTDDGKYFICYHTRFNSNTEYHEPRIKQFFLNYEGWPCILPYPYDNEKIAENGYSLSDITGKYYFINQGISMDDAIASPEYMELNPDGSLDGKDITGTWSYTENTPYMKITYTDNRNEETTYSGIFCKQYDEAGNEVMIFSAVGNKKVSSTLSTPLAPHS